MLYLHGPILFCNISYVLFVFDLNIESGPFVELKLVPIVEVKLVPSV